MAASLMDSKKLDDLVNAPVISLSRAGRNDAGHLSRKNGGAKAKKRGKGGNAHIGGGDGTAVSYMTITNAEGEDATSGGFGKGVTHDPVVGNRAELCSSPRIHPLMEQEKETEYEASRMLEFDKILSSVPKLELRDRGGLSHEVLNAENELVGLPPAPDPLAVLESPTKSGRPTPPLPALSDGGASDLPFDATSTSNNNDPSSQSLPRSPQKVSPQKQNQKPAALQLKALASATVANTNAQQQSPAQQPLSSPRRVGVSKHADGPKTLSRKGNAAFHSPERFKDPPPPGPSSARMPPVGHYRPKYRQVDNSTNRMGYIAPVPSTKPRETKWSLKEKERQAAEGMQPNTARADIGKRDHAKKKGLNTDSKLSLEASADLNDFGEPGKKGPPKPDRHCSPVFRSNVAQGSPLRRSAAPDVVYWPRDEACVTKDVPKRTVDFGKQTPRPPIIRERSGPDTVDPPRSDFEGVNAHRVPDFGRHTARKPLVYVSPTRATEGDALILDRTKADKMRYPKQTRDVDFGKQSPRKSPPKEKIGTSVEEVPSLPIISRRQPAPDLSKDTPRPPVKPAHEVHIEAVSYGSVQHRVRETVIRPDAKGHGELFNKTITQNCDYQPRLDPIRPKLLRNVDMGAQIPRKEAGANIRDLVYDVNRDVVSPRTLGNPMLSDHLSRDARNKRLSPKAFTTDETYNVTQATDYIRPPMNKGHHQFDKQVDRSKVFTGRGMPSDEYVARNLDGPGPGAYEKDVPPPPIVSPKRKKNPAGTDFVM